MRRTGPPIGAWGGSSTTSSRTLFCRAGGAEEDCWDVNGVFCNAPAYLLEG